MTTSAASTTFPPASDFVPQAFDAADFANIEPLVSALLSRPVATPTELERWILDRSELAAACSESKANLYITMTCDTDNAEAQAAYAAYIENVAPKLSQAAFDLDKRVVELASKIQLPGDRYAVLLRTAKADVEIFRPENVPLETQLAQLSQKFDQLAGGLTVQFDGREQTMPQMARYQENTDRAVRESAWRAVAERRLENEVAFNDIYEQMLGLRDTVARNAGFKNYVGYAYKCMHRFDYNVADAERFHAGIEAGVVPLMRALHTQRATALKVDALRPWDLGVDVKGRGPLRPFENGVDLVSRSRTVFERLDPRLAALFNQLGDGSAARGSRDGAMLDLDSRKGKAPGGYLYMRDRTRRPFIFMNAAGMQHDVETMVHEAGHAFHGMLCATDPLVEYRHSPIEFAEVASMSMELLSMKHWGPAGKGRAFYDNVEDFHRAAREQLKRSVMLLPWIATIDAFQHWVYANPTHTRQQRADFWLTLDARFGGALSWQGLEHIRPWTWHRQIHLFNYPFYYIEYGIAQLGALQLWLKSLEQGESAAVESYIHALSLGGSKPLPELFAAADIKFDFGPDTVKRLADRVQAELAKVPE